MGAGVAVAVSAGRSDRVSAGDAFAGAFLGGLAATRLHLQCRPLTPVLFGKSNSRSSSIEGRGPRAEERIGTLRNAAAFAVAVTVYFAGLGSWGVWLGCSGWSPGCRERVGCCLVSGGR